MAAKTQRIFELLQDTAKSLSDYKNWTSFLKSASWQYKYPFEDQVLIYAQCRIISFLDTCRNEQLEKAQMLI